VVEVGTSAALVALGGNPAAVAAGLLLYRGFTYLLEIPVGGATLLVWLYTQRRRRRPDAVGLLGHPAEPEAIAG
jgi:uncharacterized membrane protein YbhN (UPF0104 family)